MNFVISNALLLQAAPGGVDQNLFMLGSFGLIFVVFYFMIIRPQNKKQKETQKMIAAIKKGDRVQTIGGLRGVVHSVKEDSILIKVDGDVKIEFVRSAIANVIEQSKVEEAEKTAAIEEEKK